MAKTNEFKEKYDMLPFNPKEFWGVDKISRPVYIKRSGKIQSTEISDKTN